MSWGQGEALENYLSVACFSASFTCLFSHFKVPFQTGGTFPSAGLGNGGSQGHQSSVVQQQSHKTVTGWRLDTFSLKKHSREISLMDASPSWLCESSSKQPASNSPIESFGLTETSLGHIKTYRWICSSC